MADRNIPPAEMDILRYILDHHPISVRGVADHVATTKGHTRTTVLNLMERLRQKGFLERKQHEGIYRYSPTLSRTDIMKILVRDFVAHSLGGSLEPFMVYLADEAEMNDREMDDLKRMVSQLDTRRAEHMAKEHKK